MGLLALVAIVGTLTGTVGTNDAFQLSLTDPSGAPITHVDAGTYTVVVHDNSELHNFHLFGPGGVDVSTEVDTTGDQTFTVTLVDGIYTFQCDPHAFSGMRGQFAVGTASLAKPPPSPKPAPKLAGSVVGSTLTLSGTGSLHAGPATITVRDRSKTAGFVLRGPGVSKQSGVRFTGTVMWKVTFRAGRYTYGTAKRLHTFTVSAR